MLMNLCENYINSINNGAVPSIENGWVFICRDECNKGSLNSFDVYEKYLRENLFGKIPTTIEEIKV